MFCPLKKMIYDEYDLLFEQEKTPNLARDDLNMLVFVVRQTLYMEKMRKILAKEERKKFKKELNEATEWIKSYHEANAEVFRQKIKEYLQIFKEILPDKLDWIDMSDDDSDS